MKVHIEDRFDADSTCDWSRRGTLKGLVCDSSIEIDISVVLG